jgi:CubicO group peptidase (beta-lactamase class C family)
MPSAYSAVTRGAKGAIADAVVVHDGGKRVVWSIAPEQRFSNACVVAMTMPLEAENQRQISGFVRDILEHSRVPGISLALDADGRTYQIAHGLRDVVSRRPLTSDTLFDLGALNQFLVALVVLELVDDGRLDLDGIVSAYLPEIAGANADQIRVRHLLSHAAGYAGENLADPDTAQGYTYEEFVGDFNQRRMLFTPGSVFDQSGTATVLLDRIVRATTGESALEIARDAILKPLGIRATFDGVEAGQELARGHRISSDVVSCPPARPWSSFWRGSLCGFHMNPRDVVRIGRAVVMRSNVFSVATVKRLLCEEIRVPRVVPGARTEQPICGFTLGCARFPGGTYGARSTMADGTFSLRFDPRSGIVMAIAINAEDAWLGDFVLNKLLQVLGAGSVGDTRTDGDISPEDLSARDLVGTYVGAKDHGLVVELRDDRLALCELHNPAQPPSLGLDGLILAVRDGRRVVRDGKPTRASLAFFRDPVTGTPCLQIGGNAFKRVSEHA